MRRERFVRGFGDNRGYNLQHGYGELVILQALHQSSELR